MSWRNVKCFLPVCSPYVALNKTTHNSNVVLFFFQFEYYVFKNRRAVLLLKVLVTQSQTESLQPRKLQPTRLLCQ